MDMVDELEHAQAPRSLLQVQLLLAIEVLQPLIVCVDVNLNTY